jgi:hypothetical protein
MFSSKHRANATEEGYKQSLSVVILSLKMDLAHFKEREEERQHNHGKNN